MIASIEGKVAAAYGDYAVIVVGGIGYKVYLPLSSLGQLADDQPVHLFTVLVVREDALTLYGFLSQAERDLFEIITSVSGIGPKLGLAMLSTLSVDLLRSALISQQAEVFERVPGIGKKMAQKIVFELKDKIKGGVGDIAVFSDINKDVLDTLVALGYSINEAQAAIQSLPKDAPNSVEERVRLALGYFISG